MDIKIQAKRQTEKYKQKLQEYKKMIGLIKIHYKNVNNQLM